MPPAGDVFGLDGIFLTKSNPVVVSIIGINSTSSGAGIAVTSGVLNATAGIATLTLSTAAGLSTTPFYVGAKIAVSGLANTTGVAFTGYNGTFVVTGFAGTTTVSYATTGYVGGVTAGITTTGLVILVSDTQVTNTIWSSAQTHGWFGGGNPGPVSTVDRIDFSNDTGTANIRGPLSSARGYLAATGNSNYGWFGGGFILSTVDRIDFSNDSATTSVRGPLSLARITLTATGNSNYGWFGGGNLGSPAAFAAVSRVDRIDFSNDSSTASPRGPLSQSKQGTAATANSNYGWFGGGVIPGSPPPTYSIVDRIDFSNDSSTASPRGPLSSTRRNFSATGNSNYGWFSGGSISTVDRIDFSNDSTTTSVRGPLSLARTGSASTGNSNYGWWGGNYIFPATYNSTVDRIDFSNDSVTASRRGLLSAARGYLAATSGQARSSSIRIGKTGGYGWIGGNQYYVPPFTSVTFSTVDRIDFSNDLATASPRGPLSAARYALSATGNSNYGWFGGGGPGSTSTVDRIDFSNDLASTSPRGPLSVARLYGVTATGNSNYGWFGGGYIPGPTIYSTVDRIDFSNDSATASVRGNMAIGTNQFGATGNSNYGWFAGGQAPGPPYIGYSYVQRIDFSNDSPIASVRGPLSASGYQISATGNSNYGWFGNRTRDGGSTAITTIDRINFSNDSVTSSPRGTTNTGRKSASATGNSNFGWWFGGTVSPGARDAYSSVERIDFSNDLATASIRGNLSAIRSSSAATSNTPT